MDRETRNKNFALLRVFCDMYKMNLRIGILRFPYNKQPNDGLSEHKGRILYPQFVFRRINKDAMVMEGQIVIN